MVGSGNLDLIVEAPALPAAGQTVLGGDVLSRPGGKGANQAVAARRLGADTTFIGAIGNDQFGGVIRTALAGEGVDLSHLVVADAPTGVALIVFAASAANQITVAPGANRRLAASHLGGLDRILTPDSVLLLQLEIPLATCIAAARAAGEAGALVVLNAAPAADPGDEELMSLLALTDVLIVNEGEALSMSTATAPPDREGWRAFAAGLSAAVSATVVITLGESGAVAADDTTSFLVPAYAVNAVDTTGAGDAFCGAVAASLAGKRSLYEAVRCGCAAGALATTAAGAQTSLPRSAEIERLEATQGGA